MYQIAPGYITMQYWGSTLRQWPPQQLHAARGCLRNLSSYLTSVKHRCSRVFFFLKIPIEDEFLTDDQLTTKALKITSLKNLYIYSVALLHTKINELLATEFDCEHASVGARNTWQTSSWSGIHKLCYIII